MKRTHSVAVAVLALALSTLAMPAQALPDPVGAKPAELLRFVGDPASGTGNALSNGSCDVNGDGDEDAVVGSWFWDKGAANNVGAAYVLLGGADVKGGALADPTAAGAVRIDGYKAGDTTGISVSCFGDVNGDGLDDIGIGDYINNRAFVIFGAERFTGLTLNALGDRGFVVREDFTEGDRPNLSYSMGDVGDINDDGLDDIALSAVVADTQGRTNNGKVWIIAGQTDISDVNLSTPADGEVLLTLDGAIASERLGAVAKAGDVNGDGVDDFVLGAYTSTPWGTSVAATGAAYVVFGGATGNIDLLTLGTKGFKIFGPQRQRDRLGMSVSAAGDVDGDGLSDVLIGGDGVANAVTGTRNGGAAVVLGSASTDTVYTDPAAANGQAVFTCPASEPAATCATPSRRGYWINGAAAGDSTGFSVAGVGDVNDDNVPDFAIGAYGFDPIAPANPSATLGGAGATYIVHGRTTGTVQELAGLSEDDGYRIDGLEAGDGFGRQVGVMGDFDGNGVNDLMASSIGASRGGATGNGEVAVVLMGKLVTSTTMTGPSSVAPNEPATFTATVAKHAGDRTAFSDGTLSFSLNGSAIDDCSALPVVAGNATCVATFDEEVSGDVVATFSGLSTLKASETKAGFAVAKIVTTTALQSSATDPEPGQLVQLRASVADADAAPINEGSVTFSSDGQPITGCRTVALNGGDAVCTTSWSSRSEPKVTAAYSGTAVLAASTSGAQALAVGVDAAIRPDAVPHVTYGTQPGAISGEIRSGDGIATGTVEVRQGSTVLGRSSVQHGGYSVQVGATALMPGAHTLTLVYSGDAKTRGAERTIAVAVSKAEGRVSVTRSRSRLTGHQRLTVGVRVGATGVTPSGRVQIKVGAKTVKTLTLKGAKTRYTLPRFASTGTKKVSVVYTGSDTVARDTTTVKVGQK